jgi:CheY-like chemotaxis protein
MLRVLIIDQDPMVRYALRLVLEDQGHAVLEAASGAAALATLGRATADAVITDMILPDMKGAATIRAIRAQAPGLPILTMSSGQHAFAPDAARDFAAVGDLLAKPFETDELIDALARTVHRQPASMPALGAPALGAPALGAPAFGALA